ncbi:unnamed protein product, partial [Amoebophrya sp. A120]
RAEAASQLLLGNSIPGLGEDARELEVLFSLNVLAAPQHSAPNHSYIEASSSLQQQQVGHDTTGVRAGSKSSAVSGFAMEAVPEQAGLFGCKPGRNDVFTVGTASSPSSSSDSSRDDSSCPLSPSSTKVETGTQRRKQAWGGGGKKQDTATGASAGYNSFLDNVLSTATGPRT